MTSPLVSVILPVYNGAALVREAIDSILTQTFGDFELIVIDDGSRDDTAAVVEAVHDPRLRFVRQENRGLAATLNRGIELARGPFVARQDHDDLSLPVRLEKQVAFLEMHPACALVGTRAGIRDGDSPTTRALDHPADDAALRFEMLFDNPFVHSSIMLRKAAVVAAGGYATDPARQPPEDYELWSRLARQHQVANLPERLMVYREVPDSICRNTTFTRQTVRIAAENLAVAAGLGDPNQDAFDVAALYHQFYEGLSDHPDWDRMAALIRQAARTIAAAAPECDVVVRSERRIRSLRHALLAHQYPALARLHGILGWARAALRASPWKVPGHG